MNRRSLSSLLIAVLTTLAVVGCGGPMPMTSVPNPFADAGPPAADAGTPRPDASYTLLCTPDELCDRSIKDCKANITQVACEAWYLKSSNCRDMSRYQACNCDCLQELTCSDYFACGNLCFNDACK